MANAGTYHYLPGNSRSFRVERGIQPIHHLMLHLIHILADNRIAVQSVAEWRFSGQLNSGTVMLPGILDEVRRRSTNSVVVLYLTTLVFPPSDHNPRFQMDSTIC